MQALKQNESVASRRRIYFFCADDDAADNYAPKTGLTFTAGETKISKAGAAEVNAAGTVTEIGGGWYSYEFTTSEVDTLGFVLFRTSKTDVYTDGVMCQIVAFDPFNTASLGITNLDATVSSRLATASYAAPSTLLTFSDGIETGVTLQQAMRLVTSILGGRVSGAKTGIEVFRNVIDTKNRVTATIDSSGNRTSITTDLT